VVLNTPGGQRTFDARPSDAIALGSRVDAPIWVADAVFDDAGVPDEAVELDPSAEEERVEEFRRFLDDVDPDDFQG
ncbi:MAG: bifunctional nuclease family protein, partial [Xanthomonas perforans]|nr:bifunctional nuclease family protein [Xanthomonas perforans]